MRLRWDAISINVFLFLAFPGNGLQSEDSNPPPLLNEEIEVSHAERMSYPLLARIGAVTGAVVVKVELQAGGTVRSSSAISGPKLLLDECAKNAKKWTFTRLGSGSAFIIYVFQVKGVCELPCPSNFEYYPPNLVMVTIGSPIVMP